MVVLLVANITFISLGVFVLWRACDCCGDCAACGGGTREFARVVVGRVCHTREFARVFSFLPDECRQQLPSALMWR